MKSFTCKSSYSNIRQLFVEDESGNVVPLVRDGAGPAAGPIVIAVDENGVDCLVLGEGAVDLLQRKQSEAIRIVEEARAQSRKRVDDLRTAWASLHSGDIEGSVYDSDSWMTLIQQFNRWFAMTAIAPDCSPWSENEDWHLYEDVEDDESGPSPEEIEREAARKRIAAATVDQELRNEWEDNQPENQPAPISAEDLKGKLEEIDRCHEELIQAAVRKAFSNPEYPSDDSESKYVEDWDKQVCAYSKDIDRCHEEVTLEDIKAAISKALSKPESPSDILVRQYRADFIKQIETERARLAEEAIREEIMGSRVAAMFSEASFSDIHFGGVFDRSTGKEVEGSAADQAVIESLPEMPVWMLASILSTTKEGNPVREAIIADLDRREAESQ